MKNILYNFRTQVFIVVLGITVFTIAGHFLVLQPILHNVLFENELDQIHSAAHATSQTFNLELGLAVTSLESVAALEGFDQLDQEIVDSSLVAYDATNPFFIYTWVMDLEGRVISSPARPDRLGEDRSQRDYFIKPSPQNLTHFQKVQMSTRGRFSLVVGTAILNDQGEKVGVVAGSLGLMDRNPQMYKAVINAPFPDKYKIFLFSSNSILLAHSDKKLPQPSAEGLELLRNQPFAEYLDTGDSDTRSIIYHGQKYILSFSTVPITDWRIVVQVPESMMAQSVNKITTSLTILLGILLLIVLFISLFFADRFSRSLSLLTEALNTFGEGTVEEVEVMGSGEINDAVRAFNNMIKGRQEIEFKLQNSEKRFRALVEQASDAFFLHDLKGKILDVNQRACDSLGYSREELLSMSVGDIDAVSVSKDYKTNIWNKIQQDSPITVEGTHCRKDGTTFPVEVRLGLLSIHDERNILALVRDVSNRKKAEEKLRQAHKMEAIGNLAGGIAHDFNNILTAIFGNIELSMMEVDRSSKLYEKLENIQQASVRAKNLVDQILTFSRKSGHEKHPLHVDAVVTETIKLLRSSIPTTIAIKENITPQIKMLADPTELHQIVMNLCTNAYQSMLEKGGTLEITLKEIEIISNAIAMGLELSPGKFLQLEVSDTGGGMTLEVRNKIFEPYFTTKGSGKGTGLGLAVVHGIVKNYGGHISVYSEPGHGTTFKVYLPTSDIDVGTEQTTSNHDLLEGGSEYIMYVDDEEQNVAVVKEMLSKQGYRVDIFTNGVQAWQEIQKQPDKFDVVITDMAMPFMTGMELAQKIMEIRPKLPVILCTGYSENITREKSKSLGIRGFIEKPITMKNLLKGVREALDNNTASS